MMSARGSSPKMASETVTEPALAPSNEVTFSSMSLALLGRRRRLGWRGLGGCSLGEAELARLRHARGQFLLHRVAYGDPAAVYARHGAFDQDQSSIDVGLHHFQIKRGHPLDAKVARHLLVLEGPAGILP